MRHVVVEVDDREKKPILFPKQLLWSPQPGHQELIEVQVRDARLRYGDYRLARYPRACVIERKGSVAELAQNLLTKRDRQRFRNAWVRFVTSCLCPVLVVDDAIQKLDEVPPSLSQAAIYYEGRITGSEIARAFWDLVLANPPALTLWTGRSQSLVSRRRLGAQLIRLMLSAAQQWNRCNHRERTSKVRRKSS